jgi:phosphoribosylformylglycinamidine synthase
MTAYEMMLSESQERMLAILKPGREADGYRIFEKWGLDAAVIGKTTETGQLVLKHKGETVCDIPLAPLFDDAPLYDRPWIEPVKPPRLDPAHVPSPSMGEGSGMGVNAPPGVYDPMRRTASSAQPETSVGTPPTPPFPPRGGREMTWRQAILTLLACPDVASKRWLWEQYDRHVMADTLHDSATGADAGIVRVHGTKKALAVTSDCTPRYVQADPYEGGKQAVAEAWRNLTAVGADPIAITDNLNFGNPERPEIMGQIVRAIDGMAEACRALDFPVVSGNVSLYNETNGSAIPPTPTIGAVGLIPNYARRAGYGGLSAGDTLVLIGETVGALGASLYLREILGREDGAPPPVDLAAERRNGDLVRRLIRDGVVEVCHDLSDGGLIGALAEMTLASGVGAHIDLPGGVGNVAMAFGEDQARYLIALPTDRLDRLDAAAEAARVSYEVLGSAGGCELSVVGETGPLLALDLDDLRAAHEGWMPAFMG